MSVYGMHHHRFRGFFSLSILFTDHCWCLHRSMHCSMNCFADHAVYFYGVYDAKPNSQAVTYWKLSARKTDRQKNRETLEKWASKKKLRQAQMKCKEKKDQPEASDELRTVYCSHRRNTNNDSKKSTDVNMTLFCLFVFGNVFAVSAHQLVALTLDERPLVFFFSIVSSIWSCIFTWAFLFCLASHFPCFSFGFVCILCETKRTRIANSFMW